MASAVPGTGGAAKCEQLTAYVAKMDDLKPWTNRVPTMVDRLPLEPNSQQ